TDHLGACIERGLGGVEAALGLALPFPGWAWRQFQLVLPPVPVAPVRAAGVGAALVDPGDRPSAVDIGSVHISALQVDGDQASIACDSRRVRGGSSMPSASMTAARVTLR